jgi:poly(glycerol-phosphate) alpha-glucosyltransferase
MAPEAPMRVANLVGSVSRQACGVFQVVRHLALNAQGLGHQVGVFGLRDEFTDADLAAWGTVSVTAHPILGPRRFEFSPRLVRSIQDFKADILHAHGLWMYTSVASLTVCRREKLALIVTPHGTLNPYALRISSWKKKMAIWLYEGARLRKAACLHAQSESEAASIRAMGLRNPICVIPNGQELPPARSFEEGGEGSGVAPGRKDLLYVGRLHPQKGVSNLLRAWAACQKADQEAGSWSLVVAGWDQNGHQDVLKRMVHKLGIADSVLFPGRLSDAEKDSALRSAEAFVLPSYGEALPVAILEAWAYGLPVLMTRQCSLPEGFAAGAAVEADPDVASLTQGLRTLFAMSGSEREGMGARGRRLVEQRFSWPSVAKQMIAVYRWVLGGGPRPDCVREA